jgi:hypothetical protein
VSGLRDPFNPKTGEGKGRPKGSRKPTKVQQRNVERDKKIIALSDKGMTSSEIAPEVGVGPRLVSQIIEHETIRREAAAEIDPTTLSMSAQEKLTAVIHQHKRQLDLEFEQRVLDDCRRRLNEISLPAYAKELAQLEQSIKNRKGIMDRVTYKKILSCLHPDRIQDAVLKKRFEEAFRLFTELEKRVLDEKESPTEFRKMPTTYEELRELKAKVAAERKAKRAASKSAVNVR